MMNFSLKTLRESGCLNYVPPADAINFLTSAFSSLRSAKKLNAPGDAGDAYLLAYTAGQKACEALLILNGYRLKKSELDKQKIPYHVALLNIAEELTGGQMADEFIKFKKMRAKRHEALYSARAPSEEEIKNAVNYTENFLNKIKHVFDKNNPQKQLI